MAKTNFSFLDQLNDVKINLNVYLEKYSTDNYEFKFRNNQPIEASLKNIFSYFYLVKDFKEQGASYIIHQIKEGELPEDIAKKYYDTEDFWWLVLAFNDIKNPMTDWPITTDQINYMVDLFIEKEDKYSKDGYFELIFDANEDKRKIEILKKEQAYQLIAKFKSAILKDRITDSNFSLDI